jgi:hypothetical protein
VERCVTHILSLKNEREINRPLVNFTEFIEVHPTTMDVMYLNVLNKFY